MFKTLDYWSRDILDFNFLQKGLEIVGIVSPLHFEHDFLRKMFLMLYSIKWPNFIARFSLLLEILYVYWKCFFSGCDVINFEVNLLILIKPFFYLTKKSRQKFKYFENEKSLNDGIKSIFIICKDLSVAKNCLRPENVHLILNELE